MYWHWQISDPQNSILDLCMCTVCPKTSISQTASQCQSTVHMCTKPFVSLCGNWGFDWGLAEQQAEPIGTKRCIWVQLTSVYIFVCPGGRRRWALDWTMTDSHGEYRTLKGQAAWYISLKEELLFSTGCVFSTVPAAHLPSLSRTLNSLCMLLCDSMLNALYTSAVCNKYRSTSCC